MTRQGAEDRGGVTRSSARKARTACCLAALLVLVSPRAEADCGDGTIDIDEGEECDDGALNGTTACGCQLDCTLSPVATACGDPSDTDCDHPDHCDGSGSCQANFEAEDVACGDASMSACDFADTCDGVGVCLTNLAPPFTACGDPGDTDCDQPDTCDGFGVCDARQEADDTSCPGDGLFCTGVESCGGGLCLSPGNPCDAKTETCAEALGMCVGLADLIFADGFEPGDALAAPTTVP